LAEWAQAEHSATVGRACRVISLHRSLWYYQSKKDDTEVIAKLQQYAELYPTRGFDDYFGKIRNEGLVWNRKRVLRVYRSLQMKLRRKCKKRLPARVKEPLAEPLEINHTWSLDFMSDALTNGRRIRIFKAMDDGSRESLAAYADYSISAEKVIMILNRVVTQRGLPKQIRVDNGPEFLSNAFIGWCNQNNIIIKYIQPGKPMQNAYIERLNRLFREDVLNAYLFDTIEQVRILADKWMDEYNNLHPHKSLNGKTPNQMAIEFGGACPAKLNHLSLQRII
jgi:putative transposase